jgi:pentatricopeptide repeat protein
MKTILFFLSIFSFVLLQSCDNAVQAQDYEATFVSLANDSVLATAEVDIQNAMNQSFMQQDITPLNVMLQSLDALPDNEWSDYWTAFALYRKAIFQAYAAGGEGSEATTKQALELLASIKTKTSEHYALQGIIRSFSIQFATGMKAGIVSAKVGKDFKKALQLDEQNMRAYYGLGSSDYYTPEQYGGGKRVEEYILQALALEKQYHDNPVMPTWGKDEAYEILLRHYMKKEQFEKAKTLFQQAMNDFPGNYQLSQLGAELVGK